MAEPIAHAIKLGVTHTRTAIPTTSMASVIPRATSGIWKTAKAIGYASTLAATLGLTRANRAHKTTSII
ncbi:hypothetical protein PH30N_05247 [Cutibacterium modestum 30N]|jgi:hypothetical protein|uniref:Uncharacterized protein n=1 Tax=Cutibacterium modestum TaxID=2559073 RepID=A0AAD1KMJ0_9ACTN|nr:hypothetical protein BCB70_04425 [Cutibacterium modestum]MCP2380426.1 hypothetical protein [Cutibacterium modestum 30N]BCY24463.1 hypothetical protein KB1_04530 [Cutibacterium modestum]